MKMSRSVRAVERDESMAPRTERPRRDS